MVIETWKKIPGYKYYFVSDLGRIKSIHGKEDVIRKASINKDGYETVCLMEDGIRKNYFIHRLVLAAFEGVSKLTIDHKNDIKTDNRLCNLRYLTVRQNTSKHASKVSRDLPMGVSRQNSKSKPFVARIRINGRDKDLGYFATPEEAQDKYLQAVKQNP